MTKKLFCRSYTVFVFCFLIISGINVCVSFLVVKSPVRWFQGQLQICLLKSSNTQLCMKALSELNEKHPKKSKVRHISKTERQGAGFPVEMERKHQPTSIDFVQHGLEARQQIATTVSQVFPSKTRQSTGKSRSKGLVSDLEEWKALEAHARYIKQLHLRDLMPDAERARVLTAEFDGIFLDYSRQLVTPRTMRLLFDLAERTKLRSKIHAMMSGEKINNTEKRAVLHTALRADPSESIIVDGVDVVKEVHKVLEKVREYSEDVRSGKTRGVTGKPLRHVVAVGIGGSYLGPDFLQEALKTEKGACPEDECLSEEFTLKFLSNVDPVDVKRTIMELDPEKTLVLVISKTFTTAETMLNARTMRQWLWDHLGKDPEVVGKHMAAIASISSLEKVVEFGIPENRLFEFWDWVGGRYSVSSAVGAVPMCLKFGHKLFDQFLEGARSMDRHFATAPFDQNINVIMGLLGIWNMSFMGYKTRTTMPYAEALLRFPAHIQQLCMESNGKGVTVEGVELDFPVGEIDFGEPGTNGQHSFFQLLHMGQTVPTDFIGFVESQHHLHIDGEQISSHDELMANFFAQPDALAYGKTREELEAEGCPEELVPHRTFKGNRPSLSLLFPELSAYSTGQLIALYEHRTAVQGFIWGINSFDQWGVELGKQLATDIRYKMEASRREGAPVTGLNPSSTYLLERYLKGSKDLEFKSIA